MIVPYARGVFCSWVPVVLKSSMQMQVAVEIGSLLNNIFSTTYALLTC